MADTEQTTTTTAEPSPPTRADEMSVLIVADVQALLDKEYPGDGEAPELEGLVYADDPLSWLQDVIDAEAAAYADDYGPNPPDPAAAFEARRRLRSLHFAHDLVQLLAKRMGGVAILSAE